MIDDLDRNSAHVGSECDAQGSYILVQWEGSSVISLHRPLPHYRNTMSQQGTRYRKKAGKDGVSSQADFAQQVISELARPWEPRSDNVEVFIGLQWQDWSKKLAPVLGERLRLCFGIAEASEGPHLVEACQTLVSVACPDLCGRCSTDLCPRWTLLSPIGVPNDVRRITARVWIGRRKSCYTSCLSVSVGPWIVWTPT